MGSNSMKGISFAYFNCIQNKIEVGINIVRTCLNDKFKFKAIKKIHHDNTL